MCSLVADGSTAVVDGQTLYVLTLRFVFTCEIDAHHSTSPSLSLQVVGTAAVSDKCGSIGSALTSPIITFPPGALSTWKPKK